ncbi:hypothetical protein NXC24_PB00505 (plasmid) [Rhizobium sp. NXC24]|nr:hypothetical protein NXC24_PB00505 [Rhizobium sp. NXC24]
MVREPKDGNNLSSGTKRFEPIGQNAGQKTTEPKEMPANAGALPLVFFHWRRHA